MAELKKGLLLILLQKIYCSSSLHLPGYKGKQQKDTEQKCQSAIEPSYFEKNKFERSSDCISCIYWVFGLKMKIHWSSQSFLVFEWRVSFYQLLIPFEELQKTVIIPVLPASSKDIIRQMLWYYSSNVVFNDLQKNCTSCSYLLSLLQLEAAPTTALKQTVSWDHAKPLLNRILLPEILGCFKRNIVMWTFCNVQKQLLPLWFMALLLMLLQAVATLSWSSSLNSSQKL